MESRRVGAHVPVLRSEKGAPEGSRTGDGTPDRGRSERRDRRRVGHVAQGRELPGLRRDDDVRRGRGRVALRVLRSSGRRRGTAERDDGASRRRSPVPRGPERSDGEVPAMALVPLVPPGRPLAEVGAVRAEGRLRPLLDVRRRDALGVDRGRRLRLSGGSPGRGERAGSHALRDAHALGTGRRRSRALLRRPPGRRVARPPAGPRARDRALSDRGSPRVRTVLPLGLPRRGIRRRPERGPRLRAAPHDRGARRRVRERSAGRPFPQPRGPHGMVGARVQERPLSRLDRRVPVRRETLPLSRERRHGQDGRPRAVVVGEDRTRGRRGRAALHHHRVDRR